MAFTRMDGGVRVDPGNDLFPVFTPDVDNQVSVASTSSSDRVTLPTVSRVYRFHCDQACFINFGNSSVTATTSDMPFDAGTEILGVPEPHTHVAVIRNSSDGTLTATPMG